MAELQLPGLARAEADRVHATCTVCDADRPVPVLALRDHLSLAVFHAVRCGACQATYIVDPPAPEAIGRFYETAAGSAMHERPGTLFARARQRRIAADLRPLLARTPKRATVVDLGTGDGSVAAHLHDHGHRALGLDVFPVEEWRHDDVPYRQISFAHLDVDAVRAAGPPDGAVLRHVLEHVHRPVTVLSTLREAGVEHVLVLVPNVESRVARRLGSDWYYWDPPRHLTLFSPDSLRRCARNAGFAVASLRTYGIDELATSAHRALLISGRPRAAAVAAVLRPTGLVAGGLSVLQTPTGDAVIQAVLSVA